MSRLDLEEAGGGACAQAAGAQGARGASGARRRVSISAFQPPRLRRRWPWARSCGPIASPSTAPAEGEDDERAPERLRLIAGRQRAALTAQRAIAAEAVHRARDLVSEPANVLTPKAFADACADLAEAGLEVEILDQAALKALGMNALLGVAQGSAQPPYVAVMRWQGGGSEPPLALVGKGICFDTGGISIKPAQGMEDMKWDMGGAAAVFGAMLALAGRKAAANVVGVRRPGREHALGHRAAAGRRGAEHGRQDHRDHQHRRRGPAAAGRRAALHAASGSSPRRSSTSRR